MRAVEVREFGGPEVLTPVTAPDPEPGPGEAVIDLLAADVLFLHTMIRAGHAPGGRGPRLPYIPGGGAAGRTADGRTVVARSEKSYSERIVVPAAHLVPVPRGVGARSAAAVLHDGPTALSLLNRVAVTSTDTVLITGAAGGAALILAQLARAYGARVIGAARLAGTARAAEKEAVIRKAGASDVVDYASPDWSAAIRDATDGRGADVVFDGVGGELGRAAFGLTADGGRFTRHGGAAGRGFTEVPEASRGITVTGIEDLQHAPGQFEDLAATVLGLVASGDITPVIDRVLPLERAAEAHAAIAARAVIGRIVLVSLCLLEGGFELLRGRVQFLVRGLLGPGEVEVALGPDREHVKVQVRDFHARDDQSGTRGAERFLGGDADRVGHAHEVVHQFRVGVGPLVYLGPRHDQGVAGIQRRDRQERDGLVVGVDEPSGQLAVDDPGEDGRHAGDFNVPAGGEFPAVRAASSMSKMLRTNQY